MKDYLAAVDKYLIKEAEDDIVEPLDFKVMGGDKQMKGVKNFFSFLEEKKIKNPLGHPLADWRKNVKIRKSGVVEIYPRTRRL